MKDITVRIEYQLKSDMDWKILSINSIEYFDPIEMTEDTTIFDLIATNFLEPRDYLNFDKSEIKFLNFYVTDKKENEIITKFTYWEGGLNQIKEHSEFKKRLLVYKTIIQSVVLEGEKNLILRLDYRNGQLIPITNSIYNNENLKSFNLDEFKLSQQ